MPKRKKEDLEPRIFEGASAFAWKRPCTDETKDTPLRLSATMHVGGIEGLSMHVDAYLAEYWHKGLYRKDPPAVPADDTVIVLARDEERTKELWASHGMEGYCETIAIPGIGRGRQYAIFMSPFCT